VFNHISFNHISSETKEDVLLKKLKTMFVRKHGTNNTSLLKQFTRLWYKDVADMFEHLSDFYCKINI
jgi:hypothetical protein